MSKVYNQQLEKNFISAVLYLNSGSSGEIAYFLEKLIDMLQNNFIKYEIICVDDESQQDCIETVKSIKEKLQVPITVLHMSFYQGMELSMNAGRDLAIGDYVVEFDECIWNFPDDLIMQAYREVLKEYDFVCCSDKKKSKATSKSFYKLYNCFSGTQNYLESDNFRIISRRGINRVSSSNKIIPYRKALYANCGLKFKTMHYESVNQINYKNDKKTSHYRKLLAIDVLLLYTDIGSRFSVIMAGFMACVTMFLAVYSLMVYWNGIAIVGWTTTMLFLSFGFFGLFVLLAIAIKYLSLLLHIIFKQDKYLFESIEKL